MSPSIDPTEASKRVPAKAANEPGLNLVLVTASNFCFGIAPHVKLAAKSTAVVLPNSSILSSKEFILDDDFAGSPITGN